MPGGGKRGGFEMQRELTEGGVARVEGDFPGWKPSSQSAAPWTARVSPDLAAAPRLKAYEPCVNCESARDQAAPAL
jgi:hypothetical protein